MFNFLKTLFHEAGHFFAVECYNKINDRFDSRNIIIREGPNNKYNGEYNVNIKEIEFNLIHVCEIISKTEKSAEIVPLERLSHYLIRMINGCIFESIYCKSEYKICFNENSNGNEDFKSFMFQTEYHNLQTDSILKIIDDYKYELEESNILKKLLTAPLQDSFKINKFDHKQYEIDLDFLRKYFDIDLYYKIYQKTAEEIEKIILS